MYDFDKEKSLTRTPLYIIVNSSIKISILEWYMVCKVLVISKKKETILIKMVSFENAVRIKAVRPDRGPEVRVEGLRTVG